MCVRRRAGVPLADGSPRSPVRDPDHRRDQVLLASACGGCAVSTSSPSRSTDDVLADLEDLFQMVGDVQDRDPAAR